MSDALRNKAEGLAIATATLLNKQASADEAYQTAVTTTVDSLIKAGSAKAEDRNSLIASMSGDHTKALEIMSKLASANQTATSKLQEANTKSIKAVEDLGGPDTVTKVASVSKDSDKIWEETFGRV